MSHRKHNPVIHLPVPSPGETDQSRYEQLYPITGHVYLSLDQWDEGEAD